MSDVHSKLRDSEVHHVQELETVKGQLFDLQQHFETDERKHLRDLDRAREDITDRVMA